MNNSRTALFVFILILSFLFGLFIRDLVNHPDKQVKETSDYPVASNVVPINTTDDDYVEDGAEEDRTLITAQTNENLQIDWIEPTLQPIVTFDSNLFNAYCPEQKSDQEDTSLSASTYNYCGDPPLASARRLGTVRGGTYDGRYLEMATFTQPGLGPMYVSIYYLSDPTSVDRPIIIDKHGVSTSDWVFGTASHYSALEMLGWNGGFKNDPESVFDTGLSIPDLLFDQNVVSEQGQTYRLVGYWVRFDSETVAELLSSTEKQSLKDGRALFHYKPTSISTDVVRGSDLYFIIDEDGRLVGYDLDIPFFGYEYDGRDDRLSLISGTPNITWSNGSKNNKTYLKASLGGCGYRDTTHVVSEDVTLSLLLNQVGVGNGEDGSQTQIFEPSTYNNEYFKNAFNIVTFDDALEQNIEDPKDYSDFVHSYLYFQDKAGRWIEFISNEMVPPVECGKPVIYLYPESETDVSVWVSPLGGFSFTEPEFNGGWNVTAFPDGNIINKGDGLTYPYLFWEGRGAQYEQPTQNWVVEQDKVETFLRDTLFNMNLNTQEANDFVEFWLPRMQDAPFYRIGFHGTQVMDIIAPLELSVTPDHVFRVLMDYESLETKEPENPPIHLPKANRDGFEVIEWGGVLR